MIQRRIPKALVDILPLSSGRDLLPLAHLSNHIFSLRSCGGLGACQNESRSSMEKVLEPAITCTSSPILKIIMSGMVRHGPRHHLCTDDTKDLFSIPCVCDISIWVSISEPSSPELHSLQRSIQHRGAPPLCQFGSLVIQSNLSSWNTKSFSSPVQWCYSPAGSL